MRRDAPIVLAISNNGISGVRNLYVELDITATARLVVSDKEPPRPVSHLVHWIAHNFDEERVAWNGPSVDWVAASDLRDGFRKTDGGWQLTFEWSALQPNRKRMVTPPLFVRAQQEGRVEFTARIYADSLPEPVTLTSRVRIEVRRQEVTVADILSSSQAPARNGVQPPIDTHGDVRVDREDAAI